jgi:hypothetical protein
MQKDKKEAERNKKKGLDKNDPTSNYKSVIQFNPEKDVAAKDLEEVIE